MYVSNDRKVSDWMRLATAVCSPASWALWRDQVPEDFVFAVKGPRYITHLRRLKDVQAPLANFLASEHPRVYGNGSLFGFGSDQDFGDAFLVPRRGVHEHRVVAARQPDCHGTCHTDVTSSSQNDRACRADDADHAHVPGIE